jgi:hypothetical protein
MQAAPFSAVQEVQPCKQGITIMYLPHKTCTQEFRDLVAANLPGLGSNYRYWRLLEYLLFGTWVDEESGDLILSAKQAAYLVGEERTWLNRRFRLQPLLDGFSNDVFPLDTHGVIFGSFWGPNQAGRVVAQVPSWLEDAAKAERRKSGGVKVEFSTGLLWTPKKATSALRCIRAEAAELATAAGCVETHRLLNYLNGLAPNTFSEIRSRLELAHEVADTLQKDIERQHNLLQSIEMVSQPFYKPVESSTRVYSLNESFLRLKREVRKTLTEGWLKADLTSAQLAIAAKCWGARDVATFLESGNSVWPEFQAWLGLQSDQESKAKLKELLYSLLFGMSVKNLSKNSRLMFPGIKNPWQRLRKHSLIKSMLKARDQQFKSIRDSGRAEDAFGRTLILQPRGRSAGGYQQDNASSILAQIAQSYELKLMLPILDLAETYKGTSGFTITMWLHDGVCIKVHDARRVDAWKEKLSEAVQEQATHLEIPTMLVWE